MTFSNPPGQKQILYLSRVNGARSIMAEAITNAFSGGGFRAHSAGVEPLAQVPPLALQVLEERGIPTIGLKPKSLAQFIRPESKFDFVITTREVKAGVVCPSWPGQPVLAQWDLPAPGDPEDIVQHYRDLNELYDALYRCVNTFLTLPLAVMDKFALQHEIAEIGKGAARSPHAFETRLAG